MGWWLRDTFTSRSTIPSTLWTTLPGSTRTTLRHGGRHARQPWRGNTGYTFIYCQGTSTLFERSHLLDKLLDLTSFWCLDVANKDAVCVVRQCHGGMAVWTQQRRHCVALPVTRLPHDVFLTCAWFRHFFILSRGVYLKCSHCAVIESSQLNMRMVVEMKNTITSCGVKLLPHTHIARLFLFTVVLFFLYRLQNGNCGFQGTFLPVCRASG